MREIRFKFWLGHTKKMTYAHTLQEVAKVIPEFTPDIVPLQWTGLKDKHGTDIYEGDVYHMGDKSIKYVVEWHDGGLSGRQITNKSRAGFSYWQDKMEVIGNIYENPDLLNSIQQSAAPKQ